ncbi:(2Fe-2S)-binding protein [Halostreptopolyspora alba]|uniref:(2Fe-2S)-binding protein n=2 Tax=Halostreptopolyspora alba TaxID=2487137 RepID=A0A3N0EGT0_9ACTN|nr:(2Fe-2S)-binding protein [Nocardiopsaceae bacterium YIM 96095]
MSESRLRAALTDIGAINPFFVLAPERCTAIHPVSDLWNRPDLLAAEVTDVRDRLADSAAVPASGVEKRVAASLLYQGLATRVLCPVVGSLLCHGHGPDPTALYWSPSRTGPLSFALGSETALLSLGEGGLDEAAALVRVYALEGVLAPLGAALRAHVTVAPRLLWGNVASALAGAVTAVAAARPHRAGEARGLAERVLARAPLAGLGEFVPPQADGHPVFVRTTCCLYYRVPGGGTCGDCALSSSRAPTSGDAPR